MSEKQSEIRQRYVGLGMALGTAIGCGIGVAFGNMALGIGPGIAIGVAFGLTAASKKADVAQHLSRRNDDSGD